MRKSIFDIAKENLNMADDTWRLIAMAKNEKTLSTEFNDYSIFEYIDKFCFKYWAYRGRYINLNDFLRGLKFDFLVEDAKFNMESHLTLIELIYNFWNITNNIVIDEESNSMLKKCGNFYHIKEVMDEILQECNHTVYYKQSKDCLVVIENKPEVTAAAEIMPNPVLAFNVIKYNHRSLKGDIEAKKSILISLATELEPKRTDLLNADSKLSDDIFFMLNNLNIRHNNCNKSKKSSYNEYVAEMLPRQLENWYDELYQMILLAFLLLDNKERSNKVRELKDKIIEEKNK